MIQKFILVCVLSATVQLCFSQTFESRLIDEQTLEHIPNALIFISNSTKSTTSDRGGFFYIDRSSLPNSEIVISHIAYKTKHLDLSLLKSKTDTIYLTPFKHEIDEVVLKTKKSNKRKKWLKRFTSSLLGYTGNAKEMKLLNPEVVLFKEENNILKVETSKNLIFENDALGYKVLFVLEDYVLEKNDAVYYSGKVLFENYNELNEDQIINRNEVYSRSSRKFFKDYVSGSYDSLQYRISLATMEGEGFFHYVGDLKRKHILDSRTADNFYALKVNRYLRIENAAIVADIAKQDLKSKFGGATSLMYMINNKNGKSGNKSDLAVSYLGSKSDRIILDSNGLIMNQKDIIEYGYWSEMRLADMLPDDFELVALKQ